MFTATYIVFVEAVVNLFQISFGLCLFASIVLLIRYLTLLNSNRKLAHNDTLSVERIKQLENELVLQKSTFELYQKDIKASVAYASQLQSAILPSTDVLVNSSFDHFIYYKPRDIVSGDFYIIKNIKNRLIIAVGDCTGHGVPAAYLSMLGHAYLNEIVQRADVKQASQILNILRNKIKIVLNQSGQTMEFQDGMDIAVCIIHKLNHKMQFAGANMPLIIVRNDPHTSKALVQRIRGDKMPIGIHPKDSLDFTNHELELADNDTFYIFSDGFVSQFGGVKGRTFKTHQFLNIIENLHNKEMSVQKDMMNKTFLGWQGDHDQVDDVLVVGVRLKPQEDILHNFENLLTSWALGMFHLGIDDLDEQHAHLQSIVNNFYQKFKAGTIHDTLDSVLDELYDYTGFHFQCEENRLQRYLNDETKAHISEHKYFTFQILEFKKLLQNGSENIPYELILFLKDWLVNHIQNKDMNHIQYLKNDMPIPH